MKKLLFPLVISSTLLAQSFAGSFGPGPWASGSYYPGGTDGKYQASVTGSNITGVIGFSIREGSPGTLSTTTQTAQNQQDSNAAASTIQAATTASTIFDSTQNYFVIFVEGRTYTGLAVASVNPLANTVVGSLLGAQPAFGFVTNTLPFKFPDQKLITNVEVTTLDGFSNSVITTNAGGFTQTFITNTITITNDAGVVVGSNQVIITNIVSASPQLITNSTPVFLTNTNVTSDSSAFSVSNGSGTTNVFDPLPVLNRGVSGGFQAQLQNKGAYMNFTGNGQLSSPAQKQTVDLATNTDGTQVAGGIVTETVPFFVNGLRTSFSTSLTVSSTATTGQ
ncbi:MAG: hypothetical protein ACOYOL_12395 [Chthoniobacterales bacterium]